MNTVWIVVGIALVIWLIIFIKSWDGDLLFSLIFPGFFAGTVIAGLTLLVLGIGHPTMRSITGYHYDYTNRPLVALTDERSATGGTFFLGTGFIGTDASYVFYTADDDGARLMSQVDATNVRVYEDSDAPYARYRDQRVLDHPEWVPLSSWVGPAVPRLIELHVPPKSIKTGINLGVTQK